MTAPTAPRTMSSHMNQKRACPGVPNMYMISSCSRVSRPKSMATVVVTFSGVEEMSSCSTLASVITASVETGGISETDPTSVVLPAPNPPATTTLADTSDGAVVLGLLEETFESTKRPLKNLVFRRAVAGDGGVDVHKPLVGQIAEQHLGDTQRDLQRRRDLGYRARLTAHLVDALRFGRQRRRRLDRGVGGRKQCLHQQRVGGARAASGAGVGSVAPATDRAGPRVGATLLVPWSAGAHAPTGIDSHTVPRPRAAVSAVAE